MPLTPDTAVNGSKKNLLADIKQFWGIPPLGAPVKVPLRQILDAPSALVTDNALVEPIVKLAWSHRHVMAMNCSRFPQFPFKATRRILPVIVQSVQSFCTCSQPSSSIPAQGFVWKLTHFCLPCCSSFKYTEREQGLDKLINTKLDMKTRKGLFCGPGTDDLATCVTVTRKLSPKSFISGKLYCNQMCDHGERQQGILRVYMCPEQPCATHGVTNAALITTSSFAAGRHRSSISPTATCFSFVGARTTFSAWPRPFGIPTNGDELVTPAGGTGKV